MFRIYFLVLMAIFNGCNHQQTGDTKRLFGARGLKVVSPRAVFKDEIATRTARTSKGTGIWMLELAAEQSVNHLKMMTDQLLTMRVDSVRLSQDIEDLYKAIAYDENFPDASLVEMLKEYRKTVNDNTELIKKELKKGYKTFDKLESLELESIHAITEEHSALYEKGVLSAEQEEVLGRAAEILLQNKFGFAKATDASLENQEIELIILKKISYVLPPDVKGQDIIASLKAAKALL